MSINFKYKHTNKLITLVFNRLDNFKINYTCVDRNFQIQREIA